ncbi:hypothetical protein [Sulfurimonas autotrophica]|uniref:Uncharacterized protein n=1 Tax=Sulfurimonas autotrophica (strain ATCC BAA-671 / DSM 16294 / JCM 11897 / OK10) TaxID=563040 RepID=E0UPH8_SULAO|nr:hypothetical protein [Sulfurimonas autotrophica]ADN09708.1 conserved hypothetical protein [Sulfurimonas autotrophica DSM 16294]
MKKFNLFNEIITVNKAELLRAINSFKEYGINIKGAIEYAPFDNKEVLIYQGRYIPKPTNALMPSQAPALAQIFGDNYQIVDDEDRVLIKAFSNWQELIKVNTPRASYDDTTGDGVDKFADEALEDIGWNATEFNINYRTLVDVLEKECDGTLLCIEQEEPYQFSGLGFLENDAQAKELLFSYCQNEIKKIMSEDPLYAKEKLSDDEQEAAEYFKCL